MPKGKSVFESKQRSDWYNAVIKNKLEWADWSEKKISNAYICGAHFVSGKHQMTFYEKKFTFSIFQCLGKMGRTLYSFGMFD